MKTFPIFLLFLLSCVAARAQFDFTTTNGTITITGYNGVGGDVSIPGTINGLPVTRIGDRAFYGWRSLTSVTIPDSVTSIGAYSFFDCFSLSAITVDALNPAYSSVEGVLFNKSQTTLIQCPGGKAGGITIPDSVISIGGGAFTGCTSLSAISVGALNPAYSSVEGVLFNKSQTTLIQCPGGKPGSVMIPDGVTSIEGAAFSRCTSLTSVTIPSSVTSIGGSDTFYYCTSLTSVTIPDSVTSVGAWAFSGCTSLTNVTIPNSVTTLGQSAFGNCSSLTSIAIPQSVTSVGAWAFSGCTSLTSVTIPDSVTSIENGAFSDCASLTGVMIPDSVTSVRGDAFSGCTSLSSLSIPNNVTSIGDRAFSYCSSLSAITVNALNPAYSSVEGVLFNKSQTTLIQCPEGKAGSYSVPNSVTSIGERVFSGCSSLTSVTIPNSVTSIGDYAFEKCTSLTSVTIPNSVSSIGAWAFSYCASLTSVAIPDSVTSIGGGAFSYCSGLSAISVDALNPAHSSSDGVLFNKNQTTLIRCPGGKAGSYTIPDNVTSIGGEAFHGCTSLTSVTIPSSVASIGYYAFSGCASLTAIEVDPLNRAYSSSEGALLNKSQTTLIQCPGGKAGSYTIPDGVSNISDMAINNCASLTSVTIPISVTSVGAWAFSGCTSLTAIEVAPLNPTYSSVEGVLFNKSQTTLIQCPEGKAGSYTIPHSVTSILAAFNNCTSLTSVTIPDSVTGIGGFSGCTSLITVTIPSSVIHIGSSAFSDCTSLMAVYFKGNAPDIYNDSWFGPLPPPFVGATNVTVYYLRGTTGWPPTYGDRPTALWRPLAQTGDGSFGVQSNQFGFNIAWASGQTIVVEAAENLTHPIWVPVQTNTLTSDSFYFSDPEWTNHPARFYRAIQP